MKRILVFIAILAIICPAALCESALDYALFLESYSPDETFTETDVPEFFTGVLGEDYDLTARKSSSGAVYVAASRKSDAPKLPEGAEVEAWQKFGEEFTSHWKIIDGEETIYNLTQKTYNQISAFDSFTHFVILPDGNDSESLRAICKAATPEGRAYIEYRREKGFDYAAQDTAQLSMLIHDRDTWTSGATYAPMGFYVDADSALSPAGEVYMSISDIYDSDIYILSNSVFYLQSENAHYELVKLSDGRDAVLFDGNVCAATADSAALMETARNKLGYEPGLLDFAGKKPVSATLEWEERSKTISDEASLSAIYDMTNPEYGKYINSAGCPFDAFLTVEYDDGTKASIAVATDSCDTFFYHGAFFGYGEQSDLLELFK